MSGKVVHFEIPYADGDRARSFYRDVFGWQLASMPGLDYTIATTGPTHHEAGPTDTGFINGGMFQRGHDLPGTGPTVVVDVPSIHDALQQVAAAGGAVVAGRTAVGVMGFNAYVTDTEGNLVGLWEWAPDD